MYLNKLISPLAIMAAILSTFGCSSGGSGGGSATSTTSSSSSSTTSSSSSTTSSSSSASSSTSSSSTSTSSGTTAQLSFGNLHTLAGFPVGTAVSAGTETYSILLNNANAASQRGIIEQHFSQITPGNIMKMNYLHDEYGTFTYDEADALIDYAATHGIGIHAHALIWHRSYQVPAWVDDVADLQAGLDHHITNIAGHFAGKVDSWDVVNEAIDRNSEGVWGYRDSVFHQKLGPAYIPNAFIKAREADANADLYYNDYAISDAGGKFEFMLQMVDGMREDEVPVDGIGFQMHVYLGWPAIADIRSAFAQVVARGLKVKITELDIPINNPFDGEYNYPNNYVGTFTPEDAAAQKQRYCQIVEAYLDEVPVAHRGGITIWGVYDGDTWLNSELFSNNHVDWPLLFNTNFQPKPAAQGVGDALAGQAC